MTKEPSNDPDLSGVDSPADRLAERFASQGMTRKLADVLVAEFGAELFTGALDSVAEARIRDLADGWRLTGFKIWEAPDARRSAGCFLHSAGWLPPGMSSQRDMARHFKVSPEQISKEVEDWQRTLGLPRTGFQKSAKAVAAAKKHNRSNRKS
jgi:hypothetical protein